MFPTDPMLFLFRLSSQLEALEPNLDPFVVAMDSCAFDILFTKNIPHILEKIFLSLDFESFKQGRNVSKAWNEIFTSESLMRRARCVFQNEIDQDQMNLKRAVEASNDEEMKRLLSSVFIDVNYRYTQYLYARTPETLLCKAAIYARKDVVQLLLDKGAEINITGNFGSTPLVYAVMNDRIDVVKVLLDAGADPNQPDECGLAPLFYASYTKSLEMVKLLVYRGANCTPECIAKALLYGNSHIVEFLRGLETQMNNTPSLPPKVGPSPILSPHPRRAASRAAGTCSTAATRQSPPLLARAKSSPTGMEMALLLAGSIGSIAVAGLRAVADSIYWSFVAFRTSPPSKAVRRKACNTPYTTPPLNQQCVPYYPKKNKCVLI